MRTTKLGVVPGMILALCASNSFAQAPFTGFASGGARSDLNDPSLSCETAIRRAEKAYRLPPGLLFAISLAESGRVDPATNRSRPWPWAVQSDATSLYFDTRAAAVNWVRTAQSSGVASIDTGCMQISLLFHPRAFATIDAAFDPAGNVDYAARFLLDLHESTHDWGQATGFYHSRTPALAIPYQERVQRTMKTPLIDRPTSPASQLAAGWRAMPATSLLHLANREHLRVPGPGFDGNARQIVSITTLRGPPRREQLGTRRAAIDAVAGGIP